MTLRCIFCDRTLNGYQALQRHLTNNHYSPIVEEWLVANYGKFWKERSIGEEKNKKDVTTSKDLGDDLE